MQSAASLLAGDHVEVVVELERGARLEIVEVGATLVHDARGGPPAVLDVRVSLQAGARLVWDARPLVVCAGGHLRRTTTVALAAGAEALLRDTVVLGRTGEAPGALRSRIDVQLDGRPLHAEALDTSDLEVLRSPAVLGDARVLDVVARFGARGDADGALQLAGPGTLLVAVADETAQTEAAARACLRRWRDEVLGAGRDTAMIRG